MKYKIKQINYSDGTVKYAPYVKEGWFTWKSICDYGYDYYYKYYEYNTREHALEVIDLNYAKRPAKVISTEIEYIIKNK